MEHPKKASVPPPQTEGIEKNIEETTEMENIEDAEDLFVIAKNRLLHVNDWHKVSTTIPSDFTIVDRHGEKLDRAVHKGDYIIIKIPAPGNNAGEGKDWVFVEALEYDDYPDDNREMIAMRLRPVQNPQSSDEDVAHFFTGNASSTFVVERIGRKIIAYYYGRNEKPNTDTEKLSDTIRNLAVAAGAMLGFSDVQWKELLQGFLREAED